MFTKPSTNHQNIFFIVALSVIFLSFSRYGASIISGLVSHHDWVGIQIVEDTLENIRMGLELNDAKYNQRRLAVAKFLGELYNYRLIDSALVFKVCYSGYRLRINKARFM